MYRLVEFPSEGVLLYDHRNFEIGGGHFGLLHYPSELFDLASGVQRDFLLRHLLRRPQ